MELEQAVAERTSGPCDGRAPRTRGWVAGVVGVLVLLDTFDAPIWALFGDNATVLAGVPLARLPLLVVGVAAVVLLIGDRRAATASVRSSWPVWPALVLAFASTAWSDQPRKTLIWALALLGSTIFGIALGRRFSPRAQAMLVAGTVSAIALASVVAAALFTGNRLGIGGHFSGLYFHKNLLGRVVALGVAASAVTIASGRWRRAGLGALLVCGGVLVASQSVASILAAALALAAMACVLGARAYRRSAYAILTGGVVACSAAVLVLIGTKPGLRLLARRETFSDRTLIWQLVAARAAEDPWLGHGYGAFWTGPAGDAVVAALGKPINHSHNGAVDLYAELGRLGLIVLIVPMAIGAVAAAHHALRPGPAACLWPVTCVVFFIASNVAESALLRHKLYWALFVSVLCHLVRQLTADGGAGPVQPVAIDNADAGRRAVRGA